MTNSDSQDYLNLVEEHNQPQSQLNLFEKILVVSSRAKDLQHLSDSNPEDNANFGYIALKELNDKKIESILVETKTDQYFNDLEEDDA